MRREWMTPERKWMTPVVRDELIAAVKGCRIDNATVFAEEFAERHDLNPHTVRAAVSRYRREFGLLERQRDRPHVARDPEADFLTQITRLCGMNAAELAVVRDRMVRQQEWIGKAINLVDTLREVAA